jgi:hypothetical protein
MDSDGVWHSGSFNVAVGLCDQCNTEWDDAVKVDRVNADRVLDSISALLAQHQEDGELDDGELLDMVADLLETSGRKPFTGDHLDPGMGRLVWIDSRVMIARKLVRDQGWEENPEIEWLLGEIEIFADLLRVHFAGVEE